MTCSSSIRTCLAHQCGDTHASAVAEVARLRADRRPTHGSPEFWRIRLPGTLSADLNSLSVFVPRGDRLCIALLRPPERRLPVASRRVRDLCETALKE